MNKARYLVIWAIAIFFPSIFALYGDESKASESSDIISITAAEIEEMKVHNMVDLLNRIPGINASETTVNFRGFNTQKILVLLDGRELNDPTNSWRAVNWSSVSVSDIEKIDIFKGGAGGLYGEHAAGGLIRILTKKIKSGLHGSLEGHLGRFNIQKYEGIVRKKVDRFGINLSGNWEKTDGFRVNSGEKEYKFGSRLQYFHTLEDIFSLSADYSYLDAENSGPIYRLTPHAHSQDENFGVSLIMLFQKFNSETHLSLYDRAYEDPDSHFASRLKNGSLKQRIFWSPFFKYFGTLDFSADFAMEHVSGSNLQSLDEKSLGLYCGKKYSYTRFPFKKIPLQATLGLRVNLHSEFSTAVNPSLRLTYNPGAMDISFTVERFNTIPSFRRRYYNTTTFEGNPQLKIEKGTNYSLGISSKPTRSINLSASLFYSHVDDRINYVRHGQIGTYENVGSSTKKGIEASIKWKISKRIQVSCSYTYLDARDNQTNKFLTYNPEHKAIINLELNPLPDFFIGTVTKYKSTRYYNSDNSGSLSGTYFRTDLTAEYTFGNNYALFCRIDNLFNRDFHIIDGYPVTPRSLTMGLKYEY